MCTFIYGSDRFAVSLVSEMGDLGYLYFCRVNAAYVELQRFFRRSFQIYNRNDHNTNQTFVLLSVIYLWDILKNRFV